MTPSIYHQRFKTFEECFWEKSRKSDSCWEWVGAKNSAGRANFRGRSAPRIAWRLINGDPGQLEVCHHCDNPGCVNPNHLFLGTRSENMLDCSRKGRRNPRSKAKSGEKHHFAKLTQDDVLKIREMARMGISCGEISKLFPVVETQISRIVRGIRWR